MIGLRIKVQKFSACCVVMLLGFMLQVHNAAISIPGRALSGVINSLKKGIDEDVFSLVSGFHADVVSLLKNSGSENDGSAAALQERLQDKLPGLVAAAKGLKLQNDGV